MHQGPGNFAMKRLLVFGILCAYALGSTWDAKEPRSDDEEIWVHRDSSPSTPMLRKMPEYVEDFELYANDAMTIGIDEFRDMRELWLDRMLLQPFRGTPGRYPLGHREDAG